MDLGTNRGRQMKKPARSAGFLLVTQTVSLRRIALLNRVGRSLEAMHGLLQGPLQHAFGVIAVSENVVARRQAVLGAFLLHFVQLGMFELRILDGAPVMG